METIQIPGDLNMKLTYILLAFIVMLILPVAALPTTGLVSGVTNIQATFSGTWPANDYGFFAYGTQPSSNFIFSTPNVSVSGAYSYTVYAGPLLTNTEYYVKACDPSGCGATTSFTTGAFQPISPTNYGAPLINMFTSGLNTSSSLADVMTPYTSSMGAPIAWGILLTIIAIAYWMMQKEVTVPFILMFVYGEMFWGPLSPFSIPADWMWVGYLFDIIALSGIIMSWVTR
jgi:hypothetical protein